MDSKLTLREALSVLSKSSLYSVSTLRKEEEIDVYQQLKDYLYITPQIQDDFKQALLSANSSDIICLCGSSGDGKSETLTKLYKDLNHKIDFHLDATHSRGQYQSAIDCLNDQFDQFRLSSKPLAIGINIGMLQKFVKFGDERHQDIKNSFSLFFDNRHKKGFKTGNHVFYDFECYPRIEFTDNKVSSDFVSKFLQKLTNKNEDNPFWQFYLEECKWPSYLVKNFETLG